MHVASLWAFGCMNTTDRPHLLLVPACMRAEQLPLATVLLQLVCIAMAVYLHSSRG